MASIFKFSKTKKNATRALSADSDSHDSSLIMADNTPSTEETKSVIQENAEETREISFENEISSEKEPVSEESTITFSPVAENAAVHTDATEKTISIDELSSLPEADEDMPTPEEIIASFEPAKELNSQKLDDIFGHSHLSDAQEDDTAALLKAVFGEAPAKEKKSKKKASKEDPDSAQEKSTAAKPEEVSSPEETQILEELPSENADYVAVHNSAEEKTKEFQNSFSLEEMLQQIPPDSGENSVPPMSEEIRVSDMDDPYSDTLEDFEEKSPKNEVLPDEYKTEEEFDEFSEHLRNRNFKSLSTIFTSFFAFLAVLYLESATFSSLYHPEFLKPDGIYGAIFLLIDIQLILISAFTIAPLTADGIKGLFRGKCTQNTIPAVMLLVSALHAAAMLLLGAQDYPLFGSVAALFAFISAIAGFLDNKRIHRSFRIAGKRGEKWVAVPVTGESAEKEAFQDQLEGEAKFFSVQRTNFTDGFFKTVESSTKGSRSYGWTLLFSVLSALAAAGISYWKTGNPAESITLFAMVCALALPLSGVLTVALPFSHLSKKTAKLNSAVFSADAAEDYAGADVVSFTDNEIFPPKSVKVNTIRTYGKTRIDKAFLYAAMIFQKLGGPLSLVFKKAISGICEDIPENFNFLEITADGMCAKIDGNDVFVGNKDYLLAYDFGYTKDEMDEMFESHSGKIMYMVIGSELAAKFYIRYSISKRFKKTILSLFKSGICPAVKTCDPNIDADLFRTLLNHDDIPAGVIKTCDAMKDAPILPRCESSIVCLSTIANLLQTFAICDTLKHLIRSNVIIKVISMLLGIGIVVFLAFIGELSKITGIFALIYQILWLIPVLIPSLTE